MGFIMKSGKPGMRSNRVQPMRPTAVVEEDNDELMVKFANANRELKLRPLSFFACGTNNVMFVLCTNAWMGLGRKVPTEDLQASLQDNLINVGVVGALLLTLVTVTTSPVGDQLEEYGLSTDTAGQIYGVLSTLSLYCQFMCVLHCLITYVGISQLNCLEEVITWTKMIGFKFNVHYLFFAMGFLFYIVAQVFLAFTVLELPAFLVTLIFLLLTFPLPLWATIRSTQALYQAKIDLAKKFPATTNNSES